MREESRYLGLAVGLLGMLLADPAAALDVPPAGDFSQHAAANVPASGNVWTGVAQSFTAEDARIVFGFYLQDSGAAEGTALQYRLYAGDGVYTTLLAQQTVTLPALGSGGRQFLVADFSAVALVPGSVYTVVLSQPCDCLPASGSYFNVGIRYAQTDVVPNPYPGGRFYFTGSSYDQGNPVFSTRDIAFRAVPAPALQVAPLVPAGNEASRAARADAAGRFVVFESAASNLTGGPDGNGASDIFRVDLQSGATERISVDDAGGEISGGSLEPAVSADGNLVVFVAPDAAVDKLHGETKSARVARRKGNGYGIYLRNRLGAQTGRTLRIGSALTGGEGSLPQIAPDGRSVVFTGEATGGEGVSGQPNVFRVVLAGNGDERLPQPRECVSCQARSVVGLPTVDSDGPSGSAVLSADGRFIAYETQAKNALAGSASPCPGAGREVHLRNMQTGQLQRVSPPAGLPPLNCGVLGSGKPSIDWSGLNIAFQSDQALTPGALAGRMHVFSQDGTGISRLSEQAGGVPGDGDSSQPVIAGDGLTVAYVSAATNLDAGFVDSNGREDAHVRRRGGGNERLSRTPDGAEANQDTRRPALNYNGTRLLFDSPASNLAGADTNGVDDVFQRLIPVAAELVFAAGFD